ncbi:hypothetical protein MMC13_004364 [Lambiella insularis]|nr:hypothetical protein [Lambiella insularis]
MPLSDAGLSPSVSSPSPRHLFAISSPSPRHLLAISSPPPFSASVFRFPRLRYQPTNQQKPRYLRSFPVSSPVSHVTSPLAFSPYTLSKNSSDPSPKGAGREERVAFRPLLAALVAE